MTAMLEKDDYLRGLRANLDQAMRNVVFDLQGHLTSSCGAWEVVSSILQGSDAEIMADVADLRKVADMMLSSSTNAKIIFGAFAEFVRNPSGQVQAQTENPDVNDVGMG
jgi:hypothetical protein